MACPTGSAVRPGANGVCVAAVLAGFPAHRRSGADRGASAQGRSTCFRFSGRASPRKSRSSLSTSTKKACRALGQWPWPRTRVADLVTRLTKFGAVVIGFDVVFSEPTACRRRSPSMPFKDLDDETKVKLRALPNNDQVMADALKQSRVVLGETGLPVAMSAQFGPAACRHCHAGRRRQAVFV